MDTCSTRLRVHTGYMLCKRQVVFPLKYYIQQKFQFSPTKYKNVQGTAATVTGRMFYEMDIVRVCANLSAR